MIDKINELMEISEVLENDTYSIQLQRMKRTLEKSEFLISVMGQFSAGKSKLINNLVGKEILPVHITETTAAITLIKYGEEDRVEIIYKNEETEIISIEQSLELWQSEKEDLLKNIKTILIYVKSELLSTGLIIADTPGINTIIDEHITLAAEIMEASDRILYVMGKPSSDMDLRFIEKIRESGLTTMFVRTHMDNLKSTEEDINKSIAKEIELLQPLSSDRIFFVSNEEQSDFYSAISELRDYLEKNLILNIQQAIEETCKLKILFIAKQYQKELIEKETMLQQNLDGNKKDYIEKKQNLEEILNDLENILSRNEEKLKKKSIKAKEKAKRELQYAKEQAIKKLDKIKNADFGRRSEEYAKLAKDIVYQSYNNIRDSYIMPYNKMLGENKDKICEDLSIYNLGIDFQEYIPDDTSTSTDKMKELDSKIAALQIKQDIYEEELGNLELQKKQNIEKKENIEKEQIQLKEQMQEIKNDLERYSIYKPEHRVIQAATNNGEKFMGAVGNALDLVTLFTSGKTYVKVGEKIVKATGKAAAKIPKLKKEVSVMQRIGKQITKPTKLIKARKRANKIDKTFDVAKTLKGIKDYNGNAELQAIAERKSGFSAVLDFFSFEYHFKNIGKKFDKKEIVEIDRDYEKQFYREKKEIEQRMNTKIKDEINKRNTILDIDDKIEKAAMEEQIKKRKKALAEKEIKELERNKELEKEKKIVSVIQKYYFDMGLSAIDTICKSISTDLELKMDNCVDDYIAVCNIEIRDKILAKKKEINEIDSFLNSSSRQEIEEKLAGLTSYSKYLENIIQMC